MTGRKNIRLVYSDGEQIVSAADPDEVFNKIVRILMTYPSREDDHTRVYNDHDSAAPNYGVSFFDRHRVSEIFNNGQKQSQALYFTPLNRSRQVLIGRKIRGQDAEFYDPTDQSILDLMEHHGVKYIADLYAKLIQDYHALSHDESNANWHITL